MKTTLNTAKSMFKTAVAWCIFSEFGGGFVYFGCQCGGWLCGNGGSMVRKGRLVVWLRGFCVWFLYDFGANGAVGNL